MARFKRIKAPKSPYTSYLLMLAAPAIVSWYYYGALAFRAILTGIISAVVVEAVALLIMKKKLHCLSDMHAVFTGFAIAMLLPATAPIWLIGAGLAFILAATLICKGLHIISQNQDMPKAFRGTPAAFVYVALLSLAFSGFSGSSLFS